ncbi:alpha/beta hydrolase [Halobellus limi]|uniref:Acetyl esterase/lipase n=1 Tax=Halobellus limi TaxID=699433 RepID=A0A1H6C2P7_9EURY|nr:alpha/beta hydrolase [Halobellus limi]QCC48564.1 alpha/beta hydrolase [Halobellus limi]SEG67202.1 Acetyl esterase/lipase [Halobellus limi]
MTAGLADAAGIDVRRGVAFATPAGGPLRLDLYRPASSAERDAGSDPRRAALVLVPGNGWREVDRAAMARYALDLTERGYVCVVPEYRGSDAAAFPAATLDLKAAVRWVRAAGEEIGVDPARIGAFGHDAGAHLAVLAALTADAEAFAPDPEAVAPDVAAASDALSAVVGVAGTYVLEHQPATEDLVAFLGGDRESNPDAWTRASPSTYLGGGDDGDPLGRRGDVAPPILLLHGEEDALVPAMASELFYDILEEHDVLAECVVAAEAGHDVHETQRAFTLSWTEGFLDRHLR